jgi:hypothetical protein
LENRAYIESSLGGISLKAKSSINYPKAATSNVPIFENRAMGKIQCSYKIGNQSIRRNHPDFIPFLLPMLYLEGILIQD